MGGGVVAAFLGHSPLAQKVTRVVLDAPMLDLHPAVGHQADRHLRPVIGRLRAPLIWTAKKIASARFGVDWPATSYLDETTWLKVPALVTHGEDDPRVPVSISIRLSELQPSLVTLEQFPVQATWSRGTSTGPATPHWWSRSWSQQSRDARGAGG